jgi:hypothetical protein
MTFAGGAADKCDCDVIRDQVRRLLFNHGQIQRAVGVKRRMRGGNESGY